MDLAGATCLVTGANRGIGLQIARELARRPGARVLAGMRAVERDETPGVEPVHLDLSTRESIDRCCDALGPLISEIDVLVNNAGLMTGGLLEEQDVERVYAMFQVNLVGLVHLTQRVLPGMLARGRGVIVNNASISGYAHFPAASTYAAAKTGVVAFSEALRRELRGTGVSVMHMATPGVDTDMLAATQQAYGRHMDTSSWSQMTAAEWAGRTVAAIERDARVVLPPGRARLAVWLGRGPTALADAVTARLFSRRPSA